MEQVLEKKNFVILAIGLTLLSVAGSWALSALLAVLLAAKIGEVVGEADKVPTLALVATVANIAGFLIAVVAGHLSDRTRSRFGKRNLWIIISGLWAFISFVILSSSKSTITLSISASLILIFVTISKVMASAIIPDRVPVEKRGTMSSTIAIGSLIGMAIGMSLGGAYVHNVDKGLQITGGAMLIISMLFVWLVKEKSNKNEPLLKDSGNFWKSLLPPKGTPDFYWAIAQRFFIVFGTQMILAYQLYIVTDHLHQKAGAIAQTIGWAAMGYTIGAILGGFVGGPLSDKLGKLKGLTILSTAIIGVPIMLLLFFPTVNAFVAYKIFSGLGYGIYLAVHTALVSEVIPDGNSKAKDMSFISVANGLGGVMAPSVSAAAIGLGAGYNPMFVIAAVLSIGSLFMILPIKTVK